MRPGLFQMSVEDAECLMEWYVLGPIHDHEAASLYERIIEWRSRRLVDEAQAAKERA